LQGLRPLLILTWLCHYSPETSLHNKTIPKT